MTADDPTRIAGDFEIEYAAAFNRRDPLALAALLVENATIVTEWGDVIEGREAFRVQLGVRPRAERCSFVSLSF